MPTLQDYLDETRRLLRDPRAETWTDQELIAHINRARRRRDLLLRLAVATVTVSLTAQQSVYTLATLLSGGTLTAGSQGIVPVDVEAVYVMPVGGTGTWRFPLGRTAPSQLVGWLSPAWLTWPQVYALYGPGQVMLAPPPAQAYPSAWAMVGVWPKLVLTTDADPVAEPWSDAVPFGAAELAKEGAQRFDEAQHFGQRFSQALGLERTAARPGHLPYPWADLSAWLDEVG